MATLAESFLADLDELDDEEEQYDAGVGGAGVAGAAELGAALAAVVHYGNLDAAAPLVHSERYKRIMQARGDCWERCNAPLTQPYALGARRRWLPRWPRQSRRAHERAR
jgi:hypothetical protein